jgi:hypothetical protein
MAAMREIVELCQTSRLDSQATVELGQFSLSFFSVSDLDE